MVNPTAVAHDGLTIEEDWSGFVAGRYREGKS